LQNDSNKRKKNPDLEDKALFLEGASIWRGRSVNRSCRPKYRKSINNKIKWKIVRCLGKGTISNLQGNLGDKEEALKEEIWINLAPNRVTFGFYNQYNLFFLEKMAIKKQRTRNNKS
jgi:hypothetical protein